MTSIHEDGFNGTFHFKSKYHDTTNGRMAYIDEGEGEPVVMLHGNPTWSYLYRTRRRKLTKLQSLWRFMLYCVRSKEH